MTVETWVQKYERLYGIFQDIVGGIEEGWSVKDILTSMGKEPWYSEMELKRAAEIIIKLQVFAHADAEYAAEQTHNYLHNKLLKLVG